MFSEGERTFKISANSLRAVLRNHVEKIKRAVTEKAAKSLQQCYQQEERNDGIIIIVFVLLFKIAAFAHMATSIFLLWFAMFKNVT